MLTTGDNRVIPHLRARQHHQRRYQLLPNDPISDGFSLYDVDIIINNGRSWRYLPNQHVLTHGTIHFRAQFDLPNPELPPEIQN
jgi:hypothetical protein